MIDSQKFYNLLKNEEINFFTGVPDSLLNDFCMYLSDNLSNNEHIIAANEGNAVGIAAGNYLSTGKLPLVYMQNSGIGNALNPLISLTNKETYSIPMVLLIGWRGAPGTEDWAHHKKQGEESSQILKTLNIPYKILDTTMNNKASEVIQWASKTAKKNSSPVAILVKKRILEKGEKKNLLLEKSELEMTREDVIETVIRNVPKNSLFVATTGRATREIVEVRNKLGFGYKNNFLNVGSMGHASAIVNGIASGEKKRLIVCLDGDSAAIMHLGSMAIIGTSGYPNILHIILNNGAHESVGGQPSVGQIINFTGIAKNMGYQTVESQIETRKYLVETIETLIKNNNLSKPKFIDVYIRKGIRNDIPKLNASLNEIKNNFMRIIKNTKGSEENEKY